MTALIFEKMVRSVVIRGAMSLVALPPLQRCHWSHRRLCSAAIGHSAAGVIAAGIAGGGGEGGLLGQAAA